MLILLLFVHYYYVFKCTSIGFCIGLCMVWDALCASHQMKTCKNWKHAKHFGMKSSRTCPVDRNLSFSSIPIHWIRRSLLDNWRKRNHWMAIYTQIMKRGKSRMARRRKHNPSIASQSNFHFVLCYRRPRTLAGIPADFEVRIQTKIKNGDEKLRNFIKCNRH